MYLNLCRSNLSVYIYVYIFLLTVAGTHCIKNKAIDVKKALSKTELSKLQAGKNTSNDTNQNTTNNPEWNTRGSNGPVGNEIWSGPRGVNGPTMNIPPGGYGPGPNWGKSIIFFSIQEFMKDKFLQSVQLYIINNV